MLTREEAAADLIALAKGYQAGQAWKKAMAESAKFLTLVLRNNPSKPLTKILARPDVKDAMTTPFAHAGAQTLAAIREAWFNEAGDREISLVDLERAIDTAKKNAAEMPTLIRKAMTEGDRDEIPARLKAVQKKMIYRAELGVQYAKARAKTLSEIHDAKHEDPPKTQKTWRSLDWPNRCSHCLALDGVTIDLDASFFPHDASGKLKVYGKLIGPPRHPNCRCWLEFS